MNVSVAITTDLARLGATLDAIARETGKDPARLVRDAIIQCAVGGNGIQGMAQRLKKIAPTKGRISAVAALRGYRVKITHQTALDRAGRDFGNAAPGSSILFRRRKSTFAPAAQKGGGLKRLTYAGGRIVNAKGKQDSVTTDDARALGLKPAKGGRPVALNRRALAVYYELRARESSRASLAAAYAYAGLRTLSGELTPFAKTTHALNGKPAGTLTLATPAPTSAVGVLSLLIPVRSARLAPISAAVVSAVLADKQAYLARKLADNFRKRP